MKVAALALACILGMGGRASADVIRLTSGSFSAEGLTDVSPIVLAGERGFTLRGQAGNGIFAAWDCQFAECAAGSRMDLRAFWSGLDLISAVTLDGMAFNGVGAADSDAFASVDFRGGLTLPGLTGGTQVISSRFTLDGQFGYFDAAADRGRLHDLRGAGIATITLMPSTSFPDAWSLSRIEYTLLDEDALATPEPATLILVGGGLALALRRRRALK